jgi:DNA-binding CsgD family transcriptional regulator
MQNPRRWITIGSLVLVGLGIATLVVSISTHGTVNLSLPLVFLMLGGVSYAAVTALAHRWTWARLFYIPGSILVALGLIFLLNVITSDWNAWAYAWLLLLTGLGVGVALVNRDRRWRQEISMGAVGLVIASLIFFALFGAIAGGWFILIMAPILLVAGGLALHWVRPETFLPEPLLRRLNLAGAANTPADPSAGLPDQAHLVEPLSARELEVLALIDRGLSNPEIADQLTLAPSTVKTHINNIYGKLGVQGRVQALNRARELGLLRSQERR